MSLLIFMSAVLTSTTVSSVQSIGNSSANASASGQKAASQKTAQRNKARVTLTASATIIRVEKVSPLAAPAKPDSKIERPIAQQRLVKAGVPYVEFY